MNKDFSNSIKNGFKFLGIYQIIGGLIGGIWTIIYTIQLRNLFFIGLCLIPVFLYAYSIIAGVLLLQKKSSGLTHSTINQFLQLVGISILGWSYRYFSGLFLTIDLDLTNSFGIGFHLGISNWLLAIHSEERTIFLNINLIALFLVVYISKLKVKVHTAWMQEQVERIGESVEPLV